MNKIKITYTLLLVLIGIFFAPTTFAQTATPKQTSQAVSPTVSEKLNEKLNTQINQLKDKIASRVSELKLVEKRGVTGEVTDVTTNKITLSDVNGNVKLIDIDEITKFSSSSAKGNFGLSDISKGTKINVLGLYNKQTKRILARFITSAINPVFVTGTISDIDSKNFTVAVAPSTKNISKLDIGTTTRISSYSQEGDLERIGFTRLNVGDRVSAIGFPDKADSSLLVAQRVVVLTTVPNDPQVNIERPTATPTPSAALRRTTTQIPAATSTVRRVSPTVAR